MKSLREMISHFPVIHLMDKIIKDFDRFLAIAGLFLSIALGAWATITGRIISEFMALVLGSSCLFWLVRGKDLTPRFPFIWKSSWRLLLNCIFALFLIGAMAVWYFRPEIYERPFSFFVIITILSLIIALQIIIQPSGGGYVVLLETILLGLVIVWSQTFLYPTVIGSDPNIHESFTNQILATGHIPLGQEYSNFPLFHLVVASGSLLMRLDYPVAAALMVSLVQIICIPFIIYLVGEKILKNPRFGLMGALCVILAPSNIYMNIISIPNGLAMVLLLMSLYLLFRFLQNGDGVVLMIACSFMILTILTHTITAFFLAIILFVVWGISAFSITVVFDRVIILRRDSFSLRLPFFFLLAVIGWWMRDEWIDLNLSQILATGFMYGRGGPTIGGFHISNVVYPLPLENLIGDVGMYLFIFISLVGAFYLIARKYDVFNLFYVSSAMTPTIITFGSFFLNISIIQQRWVFFSEILLAIPLGIAFLLLAKSSSRLPLVSIFITIILIGTMSFFCIICPDANWDMHIFTPGTPVRSALTESEVQAVWTVSGFWNGTIMTDDYYAFNRQYAGFPIISFSKELLTKNSDDLGRDFNLVSNAIINKPFSLFTYTIRLDYDPNEWLEQDGFSRVYSAGYVNGYTDAVEVKSS